MKLLIFIFFGLILYFILDTIFRKTRYKKFRKWLIPIVFVFMISLAIIGAVHSATAPDIHCGKQIKVNYSMPQKTESANDYFEMGNYKYDSGDCEQAINYYNTAIEKDPQFVKALNNRGYTYMRLRAYDKALNDFNKALEIQPNYVQALMNRGDIYNYYYNIDHAKAIEDYNKVLVLIKDNNQRRELAVCGHKLIAENNGWSPLIYIQILKSGLLESGCN